MDETEQRSILTIYRMFKMEMKEEDYEGGIASSLWGLLQEQDVCCYSVGRKRKIIV